jgi:hypothetical protein
VDRTYSTHRGETENTSLQLRNLMGRSSYRSENNIELDLKEIDSEDVKWNDLVQDLIYVMLMMNPCVG